MPTIEHLIGDISQDIIRKHHDGTQTYRYDDFKKHPGWVLHQSMLLLIKGKMAEGLLSTQFIKLPESKRLATQEAYVYINLMIDFLLNPLGPATKRAGLINKFRQGVTSMASKKRTRKGTTKKGE